ncbi:MAG: bifunctional riboflavin kinase/FAD synthetase [Sphingobacteriaceae bacterium]|nr:bifunctional riboflavin kinase/FAD synthetase [Sphingobacteriaceae bacterium]
MLVVQNTKHFRIEKPTIVTIGTFDGVHLGHQKILSRLQQLKKKHGLTTLVLTFEPHPRMILEPDNDELKLLTLIDEKLDMLENYGVDVTVVYPFDKEFSNIEAVDYIENILVNNLHVKYLVIGYDHHFGKNRGGNIKLFEKLKDKYGYHIEEIDALDIDKSTISSSRIRKSIEQGHMNMANNFLGHNYFLNATVVHGKKLGRTLGYPTANLKIVSKNKLIPKQGVYFVTVTFGKNNYYGMLNIGLNVTTDTDTNIKIEVNIFDFEGDLYGKTLKISFNNYLREEKKFNNLEELTQALNRDKEKCMKLIEEMNKIQCAVIKK